MQQNYMSTIVYLLEQLDFAVFGFVLGNEAGIGHQCERMVINDGCNVEVVLGRRRVGICEVTDHSNVVVGDEGLNFGE